MGTDEGCFRAVQFLMCQSFAPNFPSVSPPQFWDRLGGERYILRMLLLPCLVLFDCVGKPLSWSVQEFSVSKARNAIDIKLVSSAVLCLCWGDCF